MRVLRMIVNTAAMIAIMLAVNWDSPVGLTAGLFAASSIAISVLIAILDRKLGLDEYEENDYL